MSRSLEDTIAEPRRAPLVPGLAADQAGRGTRRRARLQPVGIGAVAVRAVPRRRVGPGGRRGDDRGRAPAHRRTTADLHLADRAAGRARDLDGGVTRCSSSPRAAARRRSPFTTALFDGLAPDGGLYVPETIEPWTADEIARLSRRTLTEIGLRALRPFTRGDLDPATLEAVVVEALNFPIPLVEVEPGIFSLELFHGPTLAFKDVGARVMARLMAVAPPRRRSAHRPGRDLGRHRQRRGARLPRRAEHARRHPLSGRPRQPDAGSAADDVQRRAEQRARLCGGRQLRRLPPADARGLRRPGPALAACG